MKKRLLKAVVILAAGLILYACSTDLDNPVGPDATQNIGTTTTGGAGSPNGQGMVEDDAQDCALIQVNRAGIKVEIECLTIKVFVPAAFADYVNLWVPDLNEKLLKHCPVNEWCEYTFDKPGTYQIRFAVEKKKDDGTVWQCDRHKVEVTVKDCPPPGCVEKQCGDCQKWNPQTCQCEGKCEEEYCVDASLSVSERINDDIYCLDMKGNYPYTLMGSRNYPAGNSTFCWQIDCEETLDWYVEMFDRGRLCDSTKGSHTGEECTCEPTGEPECPEQEWDYDLCQWVGECICEPVGEPECPEQEWDIYLCQWVGECVCEPIGEPECEGQEWDYDLCQYTGQCDADCPAYEVPVVWCHVSSKRNGGIIESTMTNSVHIPPGHCMHFDPTKWCPPDYLGECDGRSFTYQCVN